MEERRRYHVPVSYERRLTIHQYQASDEDVFNTTQSILNTVATVEAVTEAFNSSGGNNDFGNFGGGGTDGFGGGGSSGSW